MAIMLRIPTAEVGMKILRSPEMARSWLNERHVASKRLELACTRFLTLVSEIAAKIEYIDFGWLPDCPQIA